MNEELNKGKQKLLLQQAAITFHSQVAQRGSAGANIYFFFADKQVDIYLYYLCFY